MIELGCSLVGLTQRGMAGRLGGVTEHAVGKWRQRLRERLASDASLRRRFDALRDAMSIV